MPEQLRWIREEMREEHGLVGLDIDPRPFGAEIRCGKRPDGLFSARSTVVAVARSFSRCSLSEIVLQAVAHRRTSWCDYLPVVSRRDLMCVHAYQTVPPADARAVALLYCPRAELMRTKDGRGFEDKFSKFGSVDHSTKQSRCYV